MIMKILPWKAYFLHFTLSKVYLFDTNVITLYVYVRKIEKILSDIFIAFKYFQRYL